MLAGVSYEKVDDQGLHITVDGESRILDVDHVVVCAGQEPLKDLQVRATTTYIFEVLWCITNPNPLVYHYQYMECLS